MGSSGKDDGMPIASHFFLGREEERRGQRAKGNVSMTILIQRASYLVRAADRVERDSNWHMAACDGNQARNNVAPKYFPYAANALTHPLLMESRR